MTAKLTIQVLGHNGAQHLAQAVEALRKIPKGEVVIRYIDNGSGDNSGEVVRRALPEADIILRGQNTGYAAGHNFGLSLCTTPFVLVHDQDVVIEWEGVKKLLDTFKNEKVGAAQGKLLRKSQTPMTKAQIIDSAGIIQTLTLNGVDRGANEEDKGQFDEPEKILAAQGACALFRVTALQAVAYGEDEYFDNDFFAYKEDIDLGWRLNQVGWKVMYRPIVTGTHARTLGKRGVAGWGLSPAAIYQRLTSPRTRLSLRNYCWMIIKNVSLGQFLAHSPFILTRLAVFFVFSVMYWPLFSVWREVIQGVPRILAKRG